MPAIIVGRHHSLFVDSADRESAAYRTFWEALARGEYQRAKFKNFTKGGHEVWLQAINGWDKNDLKDAQVMLHMIRIGASQVCRDSLAPASKTCRNCPRRTTPSRGPRPRYCIGS